jgi:hypothetical protein
MTNDTLTNEEIAALASAGWRIGGGGLFDGVVKVGGIKDGRRELRTRAEWREEIQRVSLPFDPNEVYEVRVQIDHKVNVQGTHDEQIRAAWHDGYVRAIEDARAERASDIAAHKRLLAKVEAVSVAYAEQALLLARIEEIARRERCQAVVEAIVRQAEKGF